MDFLAAVDYYLLEPIRLGTGYNPVNTVVLAVLFCLLAVFVFRLLKLWKVKMARFSKAFFPFIILGGIVRSLTDTGIYPHNPLFVTPGIYLVVAAVFLACLLLEKRFKRELAWPAGWLLVAANLVLMRPVHVEVVVATIAVAAISFGAVFLTLKKLNWKFMKDRLNQAALAGHLFEAAATFVAIDFFGYGEQHVIAGGLIGLTGTAVSLILLKALVVPIVLKLAQEAEPEERTYLVTLILALGLGPGIRDMLSATMGV